MRFQGAVTLAILCLVEPTPAARADESIAGPQADFSVLTPSMEGHYTTGNSDMFGYLPYVGGLAGLNTNASAKRFRKLVAARRLAIDLQSVHPPREAVTASSGSPSGTSTR